VGCDVVGDDVVGRDVVGEDVVGCDVVGVGASEEEPCVGASEKVGADVVGDGVGGSSNICLREVLPDFKFGEELSMESIIGGSISLTVRSVSPSTLEPPLNLESTFCHRFFSCFVLVSLYNPRATLTTSSLVKLGPWLGYDMLILVNS